MKTLSINIALFLLIVFTGNIFAQNISQKPAGYLSKLRQIAAFKDDPDWITIKPGKNINAKQIFEFQKDAFGLGKDDKMILVRTEKDKLGYNHYRFQQHYKGVPVDGAVYLVHEKNGRAVKANGKPVRNLDISSIPLILPQDAVNKAISFVDASKYMWEDKVSETMLKKIKSDNAATYYPTAELVYFDKKFSQDNKAYKLAYKTEVYSEIPLKRLFIYIDAQTGEALHTINMIQTTDKNVIAPTRYNGQQPMVIDSLGTNSYRLRETGRGGGIQTYDLHNTMTYNFATDITDTDTVFDTDLVANNAHWSAEQTYDYFFQEHGRNSYNDNGGILLSYVHYGSNVANAQWDGTRMSYGDGNGTSMTEFTTVDICGHEITHGVTQYSANLVYQDEPGAMNEGFSDIYGTCIEFFADATPNWDMGEDIGTPIRSMSNPKLYQQPNTYHGQYWDPDPNNFDNGGVHTNSGVLNYWFYLLCAGGSGTNDNNYSYQVAALGMDTAAAIAYRMLTAYLTETSQYSDAYQAGLNAASDLYGHCSPAVQEVANAFAAVGIGYPISNDKVYITDIFSPVTKCGLANEDLKVKLLFNGCDTNLQAGDTLILAYNLDGGSLSYDTLVLSANWNGGDTLNYTVSNPINASVVGQHTVNVWVKLLTDSATAFNDSLKNYTFENLLQQNIDFGMTKITSPVSGCGLDINEIVKVKFLFFGCDSFPAGDTIALAYSANDGGAVYENYVPQSAIHPGDTIAYTFATPVDLSGLHGTFHMDAWTHYYNDTLTVNDAITRTLTNPISLRDDTVTFDLLASSNYFYINTTQFSHAFTSVAAHHTGPKGLQMTGGNPMLYIDQLQFPDGMNTWTVNEFLSAKANFCMDATGWNNAILKFDLKQTHGGNLYSQFLDTTYDFTKASNMRLLVNGQQIGNTYNPTTAGSDPWVTYTINLDQYAGTQFVITFETRNIGKDTTYIIPYKLDNAYIDNVVFYHCIPPVASYSWQTTNLSAQFTNQSQNAVSYSWNFGDGATSSVQNPQHTYSDTGTYIVKLYVMNECGTDSSLQTVHVTCNFADAAFSWQATYLSVTFTNQSQNATSCLWYFGDGDTSSLQNPQHLYNATGNYTVKLYATNSCGTDSSIITIQIASGIFDEDVYNVQVFPNPAKNKIYLDFSGSSVNQSILIRFVDITGREIVNKRNQTHGLVEFSVGNISSGMYILEISGAAGTQRIRIEIE
ncbi:MAG: M4 family metallopeptidase [Bacteroidia bacterium]|nr:M4 family metallopeptidase [Bacteroidia bacterium]